MQVLDGPERQCAQQEIALDMKPGVAVVKLRAVVLEHLLQMLQQNRLLQANGRRQHRRKQQLALGDEGEI